MKKLEWASVKVLLCGKEVDTTNIQQSVNSIVSELSKTDINKIKSKLPKHKVTNIPAN